MLTRRELLRASAVSAGAVASVGVLAACTSGGGGPAPTDPGGPEDPDRGLRAEIGRSETALVELYAAAADVLTGPTKTLVVDLGQRHAAYRQAIDPDGLATTLASPSGSETAPVAPSASPVPSVTRATAITVLRDAETRAAKQRAAQCVRATDAELARVVALAGAGCASAAQVLGGAS